MGLDMYLYAERDVPAAKLEMLTPGMLAQAYEDEDGLYLGNWAHSKPAERELAQRVIEIAGLAPLLGEDSNHVEVRGPDGPDEMLRVAVVATYWRKANQVHGWFVDNVQGGVDECQRSEVRVEQLAQLARQCEDAATAFRDGDRAKAAEVMAPRPGFFFGSYDIDEYWLGDLVHTYGEIRRVIAAGIAAGGVRFYYRSSW